MENTIKLTVGGKEFTFIDEPKIKHIKKIQRVFIELEQEKNLTAIEWDVRLLYCFLIEAEWINSVKDLEDFMDELNIDDYNKLAEISVNKIAEMRKKKAKPKKV